MHAPVYAEPWMAVKCKEQCEVRAFSLQGQGRIPYLAFHIEPRKQRNTAKTVLNSQL